MRAVAIERFGDPEELHSVDIDEPPLAPDGVRIQVAAASVNPVDTKIRAGAQAQRFPYIFPAVLGWDASGTVTEVGPGVVEFAPGDEVITYCRADFVGQGAYAETVCAPVTQVARRGGLDEIQGAGLPLAGLTAYQCLHDTTGVRGGETVIVRGASGGVGCFAVQIAAALGARVIALAGRESEQFVAELGADEVVDYHDDDVLEQLRALCPQGADALVDLVGGDQLDRFAEVVRAQGRVASVLVPLQADRWSDRGLSARYVFVRRDGAQLARLVELHDRGQLRVPVHEVLRLEQAAEAHRRLQQGGMRGKLLLQVRG